MPSRAERGIWVFAGAGVSAGNNPDLSLLGMTLRLMNIHLYNRESFEILPFASRRAKLIHSAFKATILCTAGA